MEHIKSMFNSTACYYDMLISLPFSILSGNKNAVTEKLLEKINLADKTVLEIGCGTGLWSNIFLSNGAKLHGIDFSQNMINVANKKLQSHENLIKFELHNANDLSKFKDNSFSIVTASFVLHDLKQEERLTLLNSFKRIATEYILIFDYGSKTTLFPRFIEYIEKSDYKNFIKTFNKELNSIYNNIEQYNFNKGASLYICRI